MIDVERALADGELEPGAQLPAVRALASQLSLSPATVAAGYRELARRGVVRSEGRRGTHVTGRPPVSRLAPTAPRPAGGTAPAAGVGQDLSIGNPDPKLLPHPAEALFRAAHEISGLYGQHPLDEAFTDWAARDLEADGIDASVLTAVSGALDGIQRLLDAWLRPGDAVAVEDPGYPPLFDLLRSLGLRATPVPLDAVGMTPDGLAAALTAGVAAVVVTSRAQNPTGAALSAQRVVELRQVLDRHGETIVIEDDHAGPVAGEPARTLTGGRERWAVVRSVAKSLGPDFRLAVLAGDRLSVARVEGRQHLGPGWVSRYLQRAAALLGEDPQVQARLADAARTYTERRLALQRALADRGIASSGASGMNVWVPVVDEAAVVGHLAAGGRAVSAGARFRLQSEPGLRVTTAALPTSSAEGVAQAIAEGVDATVARTSVRLG